MRYVIIKKALKVSIRTLLEIILQNLNRKTSPPQSFTYHNGYDQDSYLFDTSVYPYFQDSQHLVQIKAQPIPDFTAVFKPELNHKITQPEPFSFEERNKEMKLKKEEKIKTILEEEKKVHIK